MSYVCIQVKKSDTNNGTATIVLTEPIVAAHLTLEGYSVSFTGQFGTGDHTRACVKVAMPLSERQILSWVSGPNNGPRNSLILPIEPDRMCTVQMGMKMPIGVQNIHLPQSFQIAILNADNDPLSDAYPNEEWTVTMYFSFRRAALF